jgi:hypothetical protein
MERECIICRQKKTKFTNEHVFPAAIGGAFQLTNVCSDCNLYFGKNIDAPFVKNKAILLWRKAYQLWRKDKRGDRINIPNPLKGKFKDEEGNEHYIIFNEKGMPEPKRIPKFEKPVRGEGGFWGKMSFDYENFTSIEDAKLAYAKKFDIKPDHIEFRDLKKIQTRPNINYEISDSLEPIFLEALKIGYEFTATYFPSFLNDKLSREYAKILLNSDFTKLSEVFTNDANVLSEFERFLREREFMKDTYLCAILLNIPAKGVFCSVKIFSFFITFRVSTSLDSKISPLLLINAVTLNSWWTNIPYEPIEYGISLNMEGITRAEKRIMYRQKQAALKNRNGKIPIYDKRARVIYNDIVKLKDEILLHPGGYKIDNGRVIVPMGYSKGLYFVKHMKFDRLFPLTHVDYIFKYDHITQ